MTTLSPTVLRHGRDAPTTERIALRAGPLRMLFEPGAAFLRYVRLGHREVLRGVYAAVRDQNWDTIEPEVSNLHVEAGEDRFLLAFDVRCREREIDFLWRGTVRGEPDGTVCFTFDGEALSAFRRNRIGFCVLHPVDGCAGEPCRVEHTDGTIEESRFPRLISPHQPFFDIRAIVHRVAPNLWAETRFEGDIFEMEDQRNWTDASFKTYCTPLAEPFPVDVPRGTRIRQVVTLRLTGEPLDIAEARRSEEVILTVGQEAVGTLPPIGLGCASHGEPLSEREIDLLRVLGIAHLRVDIDLSHPGHEAQLAQAAREAWALGLRLEVALFLGEQPMMTLESFLRTVASVRPPVVRWIVFHKDEKVTSARWARLARRYLQDVDPRVRVGGGTNAYFTELNRERPDLDAIDFAAYSLNPQVHAFDDASLVETLPMQAATVESARAFLGDLPIAVTPITLRPRFNPNATGPEPGPPPGELPSQVDVRQMSLFGAAWTVGSLKAIGGSGVESVTYYETTGWRGLLESEAGPRVPERFRSIPGGVFPLYHVFADVGSFADGEVLPVASSDPLRADALALRQGNRRRFLVANLSDETACVQLALSVSNAAVRVRALDETNAEAAMREPDRFREEPGERRRVEEGTLTLELRPYAVARVDLAEGDAT